MWSMRSTYLSQSFDVNLYSLTGENLLSERLKGFL